MNANAIICTYGAGGYEIMHDIPPDGVGSLAPELFPVVTLDGSRYDLCADASWGEIVLTRRYHISHSRTPGRSGVLTFHVVYIQRGIPRPQNATPAAKALRIHIEQNPRSSTEGRRPEDGHEE